MGDFADLTGDRIPLVCGDKTYYVPQMTDKLRGQFERRMEISAMQAVQANREMLGADYKQVRQETMREIATGYYTFMGEGWWKAMEGGINGQVWLMHLLLQEFHPDITKEDVFKLCISFMDEIMTCMYRAMGWSEEDIVKKKAEIQARVEARRAARQARENSTNPSIAI